MMKELNSINGASLNNDDEVTLLILTHYLNWIIEGVKYGKWFSCKITCADIFSLSIGVNLL